MMGTSSNSIKLFGVVISTENNQDFGGSLNLRSRNKGRRWNEDEHRAFLIGLETLGRGNWAGIAKYYVPSRTHTQVASHAQKYFARLEDNNDKVVITRHNSVFDINLEESSTTSSTSAVEYLKGNNSKGKVPLNQEGPISAMPISYSVPGFPPIPMAYKNGAVPHVQWLSDIQFNGNMTNYMFATSDLSPDQLVLSQSMDNLDLSL